MNQLKLQHQESQLSAPTSTGISHCFLASKPLWPKNQKWSKLPRLNGTAKLGWICWKFTSVNHWITDDHWPLRLKMSCPKGLFPENNCRHLGCFSNVLKSFRSMLLFILPLNTYMQMKCKAEPVFIRKLYIFTYYTFKSNFLKNKQLWRAQKHHSL